jgi:hypothetical protein
MVLLFNIYITDESSNGGYWDKTGTSQDRGNLPNHNKLEILKYCLASLSVAYPWKRAIINAELDGRYNTEENIKELEEFIRDEFKETDLIYSSKRNINQHDWQETYKLINDDLILFQCNHDHIFIDSSLEYLKELVSLKEKYNENFYIAISHFPEHIRMSRCGYIDLSRGEYEPNSPWKKPTIEDNHICVVRESFDSIAIFTKQVYENWFMEGNWDIIKFPEGTFKSGKIELGRAEGAGVIGLGEIKRILRLPILDLNHIIPYKELFRHFDGYWHQFISTNQCPAISIPPGFFENDIKIRYGYDDYKEGWVNINPKNPNYYAFDKSGADYKFTIHDLPLIWKSKTSVIDSNPDIDEEEMIQYRLKAVLETIYNNKYYDPYIDEEIENNVLKYYMKSFPQYNLI